METEDEVLSVSDGREHNNTCVCVCACVCV